MEHLQMTASIDSSNGNYMFKVNNRNTGEKCEMRSKLKKIAKRRHCRCSHVFLVNFEHVNAGWDNTLNVLL